MASGTLGRADLAAATETLLYTVPGGTVATVTVNFCNRAAPDALIKVAVSPNASSSAGAADYVEFSAKLIGNGVYLREKIVMGAGDKLFVVSSVASVSARAEGFEDAL